MSTISSVGGASSAWSDLSSARASAMKERMFAKVDSDGSGSIDTGELQGLLDHIGEKSGTSLGSATDLLGKMDSDGNGSLSKDELDSGTKSLMPAPSSTMDFAQQRADGSSGPPPGGGGPPPPSDSASGSASSSGTQGNDPLDTDGDGVVSAKEQAAGDLKALMEALVSATAHDGNKSVSTSEADSFRGQLEAAFDSVASPQGTGSASNGSSGGSSADEDSSSSRQRSLDLSSMADQLLKTYGQTAANQLRAPNFSVAA
ncbi:MAG: EF-hand domain-containing protein [Rhizobacter sp.]